MGFCLLGVLAAVAVLWSSHTDEGSSSVWGFWLGVVGIVCGVWTAAVASRKRLPGRWWWLFGTLLPWLAIPVVLWRRSPAS